MDGISESKSSVNTLDVYSLKFNHCRNVYPFRIIKPSEKFKYDEQEQLQEVLRDLNENDVIIDNCSMDNPKRSVVKCAKTAAAKFGCEYCVNCAVPFLNSQKQSIKLIRKRYEVQEKKIVKEIQELEAAQEDDTQNEDLLNLRKTLTTLNKEKEVELKKKEENNLPGLHLPCQEI